MEVGSKSYNKLQIQDPINIWWLWLPKIASKLVDGCVSGYARAKKRKLEDL